MNIYTIILVPLLYISFGYVFTYAFYYFAFAWRFFIGWEFYIVSVFGVSDFILNIIYVQYYFGLTIALFSALTYFFKMFRSSS